MRARFYAAETGKALIQISTELGKPEIKIGISDNKLDWKGIVLNKEQRLALIKFLNETPME